MTIKEAYDSGRKCLEEASVSDAGIDAWYLLEFVTGIKRADYYMQPGREMTEEEAGRYRDCIERRSRHIPLQHLTGEQEFMGLKFQVDCRVLIPRQDTEVLAEHALRILERDLVPRVDGRIRLLDLCTGSGCILLSVLHHADKIGAAHACTGRGRNSREKISIEGTGADLSKDALEVAEKNAGALGEKADFIRSDLFENVSGRYGMILSNPPYIRTPDIQKLQDEVRLHDPFIALDGKEDGLYFYRRIIRESPGYLEENGWLILEIGSDQAGDVSALMEEAGFQEITVKKDLAGLDRVVSGVLK